MKNGALTMSEWHEIACLYYLRLIFQSGDVKAIREAAEAVMQSSAGL